MQSLTADVPWLEYSPQQGAPVQKSLLTSFPFSIGRNDSTDLPINSTRVSREHAAIVRAGHSYRIRDLDSTNGTYVNGERIDEATLTDGDIVSIADVEFTFFSGAAQAPRKTVTQVIGFRESNAAKASAQDVVRSLRRLQESVLQSSPCASRRTIVELTSAKPVGYEAVWAPEDTWRSTAEADRLVLSGHPRLGARLRELFCLLAADWVADHVGLKLFLPLEPGELDPGVADRYLDLIEMALPDLSEVALCVPDSAVNDIAYFQELYRRLKTRGVLLCYSDFAAGKAQFEVHKKMPPDFLKLSRAFARGVLNEPARKGQLEAMVADCRASGCEVIVPEVENARDAQIFARIGCRYATETAAEKSAGDGECAPKEPARGNGSQRLQAAVGSRG